MSRSIYILQLPEGQKPTTIKALWALIEPLEEQAAPSNPLFADLARAVMKKYPGPETPDSVWLNSPLKEAEGRDVAVWHLELPTSDTSGVMVELVQQGTALGLTLYDDQMGLGFLPGEEVVPKSQQKAWKTFVEEQDESKRPSIAKVRKMMRERLTEWLTPHGFVQVEDPQKGNGLYFHRDVESGWQEIVSYIEDRQDRYYCEMRVEGYCKPVHDIHEAAIPSVKQRHYKFDYWFQAIFILSPPLPDLFRIDSSDQVHHLGVYVTTVLVSLLERVRDLEGVHWMHNSSEATREDGLAVGGVLRYKPYTSLICAWLFSDPIFDDLVEKLTYRATTLSAQFPESAHLPAELESLLKHLREHVKPLK